MFQQVRHDLCGCFSKRIRKYAGDFPKLAKVFWWDKGTADKIKLKEIGNPFGIFAVNLFAFDGLDILGMGEAYMDAMFEVIKNRNPVLPCGFHTNMITVVFN